MKNTFLEVFTTFGHPLSERIYFDQKLIITDVVEDKSRIGRKNESAGLGQFGALYLLFSLLKKSKQPTTLNLINTFGKSAKIEKFKVIRHDDVNRILIITLQKSFLRSLIPFSPKIERKVWFRVLE